MIDKYVLTGNSYQASNIRRFPQKQCQMLMDHQGTLKGCFQAQFSNSW